MYRYMLILHLLGAAIWTGGHIVLATTVLPRALRARDPSIIRAFEDGYERIGLPALLVQVLTGLWLAHFWVPDFGAWFSPESPQARFILVKLILLAVTLVLAVHARLRIIPKLDAGNLRFLAFHIVSVTIIAVCFLVFGVGVRTGGLF